MTFAYLQTLAARLAAGPVPTQEKKLYAVGGPVRELIQGIPRRLLIEKSLVEACAGAAIPEAEEKIRAWLPQHLSPRLARLQQNRPTSLLLLSEAELLYRYQVPLTFLYDLTGDAHAIVLHWRRIEKTPLLQFPSYIKFDAAAVARFFAQSLGPHCFIL